MEQADLELVVEQARHGDPDAWEALYTGAYPGLIAFARRRLMRLDMADDAVSETFERAYSKIDSFRWRDGGFNAWLYTILRNVVKEMTRKHWREAGNGQLADIEDSSPEPLSRVLQDEEAAAVRAAFAQLRSDEQELLELRVLGRLDSRETAALLGRSRARCAWRSLAHSNACECSCRRRCAHDLRRRPHPGAPAARAGS